MKNKIICGFIYFLTFVVIILPFNMIIGATHMDFNVVDNVEQKIECKATVNDDFSDNIVIVVMNHNASMELKEYTTEDFKEIRVKQIIDVASSTRQKASAQLEQMNQAVRNRMRIDPEAFESYINYNQVICLELEDVGKDKVLDAIDILHKRDDVMYAGPDYSIRLANNIPEDLFYDLQAQYFNLIQLPQAWNICTGSVMVTVGVVDSGIDSWHPELGELIQTTMCRDFTRGSCDTVTDVIDSYGHGTKVAGVIGSCSDNGEGISGVCWNVSLVSLRIADGDGNSSTLKMALAVNYANDMDIPILNISWGYYSSQSGHNYSPLKDIIENYTGLVVCAAGNEGINNDSTEFYPANYKLPNVISVGASNMNDQRRTYTTEIGGLTITLGSNYGKNTVDLFAPGESILTTNNDYGYVMCSGTSFAAPIVTGVAALMLANNPNLEPHEIKCIIMQNVDDCGTTFDNECVSGGRLNAYKALTGSVDHEWNIVERDGENIVECYYCKYTCDTPTFTNLGEIIGGHRVSCTECGINYTEPHSWERYQTYFRCEYCNCTTTNNPGILSWRDQELTE